MIFSSTIQDAINFAIKTHETDQKQRRKVREDVPYIVHPFAVGLILARVGASDEVIAAGILHDTIEDSLPEKKVTHDMLTQSFSQDIANIVESVTEKSKDHSWEERKGEALARIKTFSNDSVLVKSADIISNATELVSDYAREGEAIFTHFSKSKEQTIAHYQHVITELVSCWKENPLRGDLNNAASSLNNLKIKK